MGNVLLTDSSKVMRPFFVSVGGEGDIFYNRFVSSYATFPRKFLTPPPPASVIKAQPSPPDSNITLSRPDPSLTVDYR